MIGEKSKTQRDSKMEFLIRDYQNAESIKLGS